MHFEPAINHGPRMKRSSRIRDRTGLRDYRTTGLQDYGTTGLQDYGVISRKRNYCTRCTCKFCLKLAPPVALSGSVIPSLRGCFHPIRPAQGTILCGKGRVRYGAKWK